jgi:HEAT repeat protein
MPVGVDCPACQHKFLVPDKMSGRGIKCPRCEHSFNAPNGSQSEVRLPPVTATAVPEVLSAPVASPLPSPPPLAPLPIGLPPAATAPPLPLAQAVTAGLPSIARPPLSRQRRGLTRLVLDLPETMMRNVPKPLQGITALAMVALAVGLIAWALGYGAKLEIVSIALAVVGLLFSGVAAAALVNRHERGVGLPVAALLVNLQALIFAAAAAIAGPAEEVNAPANRPPTAATVMARLRQQLKDVDQRERLQAAFSVVELARDLNKSTLDLMALLKDPQKDVRAAAAEALGLAGPQARIAYPALAEVNRADADENVRGKAKEALKKIGQPGSADVAVMIDTFSDRRQPRQARAAAALVLGLIGAEARVAVPALEEGLKDPEAVIRVSAAQALWQLAGRQAEGLVDVFIGGLKDFDPAVRAQAAYALIAMRSDARDAAAALETALADSDTKVRWHAAMALWAIGPAANAQVPKLLETLHDSDAKVRLSAAMGLWVIARHKDGIPILCEALKNADATIRVSAAKGLHTICKEAKANQLTFVDPKGSKIALVSAVPALIKALEDQEGDVRGVAALTLGVMGKDAAAAVRPLISALKHADVAFRAEVAFALGDIGEEARPAVRALTEALSDRDNTVRVFAAEALYKIERRPGDVVPTLVSVFKDRDGNVRARAAKALGNMGEQARPALPDLNAALKDSNPSLRLAAATALGKIGPPAVVTYPTLDQLAKEDSQPEIKKAASTAMRLIGAPKKNDIKGVLIPALKDSNAAYRAAAAVCLWMLFHEARSAVPQLSEVLFDADATVRGTAAFALAAIGPDAAPAVPQLIKALKSQGDETLQVRAAYALGEIGPAAKEALGPLREALDDKKPAVRLHAAQALWAIDPKAEQVVPALTRLLEEKELDTNLLVAAVETLSKIGSKGPPDAALAMLLKTKAVPALTQIIGDSDEALQLSAISALGAIGVEGREGVPKLIDMLREADSQTRLAAIEALVKIAAAEKEARVSIRAKTAFAALAFISKVDSNQVVARAASMAMTKIGQPVGADVPGLIEVAADKNQPLLFRASAAQVLSLVAGQESKGHIEVICKLLATDQAAVRILAADALGGLGPDGKAALAPLLQALKDDDVNVRVAVVQALGDIGQFYPTLVEATLRSMFLNEMEATAVREAAAEALQKLKK